MVGRLRSACASSRAKRSRPNRSRSASAILAAPASRRNCPWSSSPRTMTASPAQAWRSRTTTPPENSSTSVLRWKRSSSRMVTMSLARHGARRSQRIHHCRSSRDALLKAADALRDRGTVVFNAGAIDDRLREQDCRANVIHIAPTHSMLADGLGNIWCGSDGDAGSWWSVPSRSGQALCRRAAARRRAFRRQDRPGKDSRIPAAPATPTAASR